MITSQIPVDRWRGSDRAIPTLADAILDRVIHNAYRIDLAGESLRKATFVNLKSMPDLTNPVTSNIIDFDPRKQTARGRHQIGTVAGFRSV